MFLRNDLGESFFAVESEERWCLNDGVGEDGGGLVHFRGAGLATLLLQLAFLVVVLLSSFDGQTNVRAVLRLGKFGAKAMGFAVCGSRFNCSLVDESEQANLMQRRFPISPSVANFERSKVGLVGLPFPFGIISDLNNFPSRGGVTYGNFIGGGGGLGVPIREFKLVGSASLVSSAEEKLALLCDCDGFSSSCDSSEVRA